MRFVSSKQLAFFLFCKRFELLQLKKEEKTGSEDQTKGKSHKFEHLVEKLVVQQRDCKKANEKPAETDENEKSAKEQSKPVKEPSALFQTAVQNLVKEGLFFSVTLMGCELTVRRIPYNNSSSKEKAPVQTQKEQVEKQKQQQLQLQQVEKLFELEVGAAALGKQRRVDEKTLRFEGAPSAMRELFDLLKRVAGSNYNPCEGAASAAVTDEFERFTCTTS